MLILEMLGRWHSGRKRRKPLLHHDGTPQHFLVADWLYTHSSRGLIYIHDHPFVILHF